MGRRFPATQVVTVEGRGHAPDLAEPEAVAAIRAFLRREDVNARW